MDQLDAITLFYLLKNSESQNDTKTLKACAEKFLQTKEELNKLLSQENPDTLREKIKTGNFSF